MSYSIMPDTYQDIVYRLTYRMLAKVAPWIPAHIKPNHITMLAFFCALLANLLLVLIASPSAYLCWIFFNFAWYVLDALDGLHARRTKQCSEYGAYLDHLLDNVHFIFMFTAFIIKFKLYHPLFLFIILLRQAAATAVFISQSHTSQLYLPRLSGGTELILLSSAMLASFIWPQPSQALLFLNHIHAANPLDFSHGFFMKIILLIYLIGTPIAFYSINQFVKNNLNPS